VFLSQQWSGSSEMSPLGVSPLHLAPSGFTVGAGVGSGVGDLVGLGVGDDVGMGVLMLVHHFWSARGPICVCSVFRSQHSSAGMAVAPLHFSVGAGVGVFVGLGVGEGVGAGVVGAAVGVAVGVGVGERELGVSLHHRCDISCAPNLTTFVFLSQQWSGSSEMSPLGVSPLHLAPSGFTVGAGVGSGVGFLVGLGVGDDVGAGVLMLVHHRF